MVVWKPTTGVICLTLAALVALLTAKAVHVAAGEKEGWAGLRLQIDSPRLARIGVLAPGGPADIAGLRLGEEITRIDIGRGGTTVHDSAGLRRLAEALRPGDQVRFSRPKATPAVVTLGTRLGLQTISLTFATCRVICKKSEVGRGP